jgi:hypothetical protein
MGLGDKMVAWCKNCQRPVNQYCDRCGEGFGTIVCEKYACGGTMMCPICGGKELQDMKDVKMGPDPYDYSKKGKSERQHEAAVQKTSSAPLDVTSTEITCAMCRFKVQKGWKFCPECGVKFSVR